MKRFCIVVIVTTFFLQLHGNVFAQASQPPFYEDIQAFKRQDSINPPPRNAIVFAGSSSFTKWQDVQEYFPGVEIINRGFGGSTLPDLIGYTQEVIIKYHPRQVVIYCGENDLASSDTVTASMVVERFKQLFRMIRQKLPSVNIVFISLKPSPSREKLFPRMVEVNTHIRNFLASKVGTSFVDVYSAMLNSDGEPREDLFVEDRLHMNKTGYEIWQKQIAPHLLK